MGGNLDQNERNPSEKAPQSSAHVPLYMTKDSDQARLQELGYKQELKRELSVLSNFAFSFSIISILAGITTLYNTGLTYGGPLTMVYGWPIAGIFTMFVGLSMAEICSAYPTSGGLYFWSYKLSGKEWGPFASWMTGWMTYAFSRDGAVPFSKLWHKVNKQEVPQNAVWLSVAASFCMALPHNLASLPQIYVQFSNILDKQKVSATSGKEWGPFASWMTGWFNIVGQWAGTTSVDYSLAQMLQVIVLLSTGGINGDGYKASKYVVLGLHGGILLLHAILNSLPINILSFFGTFAAAWNIVGVFVLMILIPVVAPVRASSTFVFKTFNTNTGAGIHSKPYIFVLGLLMSQYTLSGYDSLAHMIEETKAADKNGPYGIISAIGISIIVGWGYILGITFAVNDIDSLLNHSNDAGGYAMVSTATIGMYIAYALPILFRIILARRTFVAGPFNLGSASMFVGYVAVLWVATITVLFSLPVRYPVTKDTLNYTPVAVGGLLLLSLGSWILNAKYWFKGPCANIKV